MKLYICGPMTGYPRHNEAMFDRAARCLRALGHTVTSPLEFSRDVCGFDLDCTDVTPDQMTRFWRHDVNTILHSDGIVLLPGWEHSRHGRIEIALAVPMQLKFYDYDPRVDKIGRRRPPVIETYVCQETFTTTLDNRE